MNRFLSLVKQDLTLAYRGGFFLVIVVLAAIFVPLINYAVPSEVKVGVREYVVDLTDGQIVASTLLEQSIDPSLLLSSIDELEQRLSQGNSVGIVFSGTKEDPKAVIYHQGNEPEKAIKLLSPAVATIWGLATGDAPTGVAKVEQIRPSAPKPPFNKTLVPLVLATEVVLLGFFLIAVMVFQEKAERTLRAYRVSPATSTSYIASKVIANLVLATVYALAVLVFTLGTQIDYLRLMALTLAASFVMTVFGLLLSTFFDNISEFLYTALLVFAVLGLPMGAYFFPSFRLTIFPYIPTYPVLFGMREIIFPTGNTSFFGPMMLTLLSEGLVLSLLCKWAVDNRLMKEVR